MSNMDQFLKKREKGKKKQNQKGTEVDDKAKVAAASVNQDNYLVGAGDDDDEDERNNIIEIEGIADSNKLKEQQ